MTEDQEKRINPKHRRVQRVLLYAIMAIFTAFFLLYKGQGFNEQYPNLIDLAYGIFFALLTIYWIVVISDKEFYGRRGLYFMGKTAVWIGVIGLVGSIAIAIKFFIDYIQSPSGF
jgi:hypothetical protein